MKNGTRVQDLGGTHKCLINVIFAKNLVGWSFNFYEFLEYLKKIKHLEIFLDM